MITTVISPVPAGAWPALRGLATTLGEFDSCYIPGDNGRVVILGQTGGQTAIPLLRLADWRLTVEDGKLVVVAFQYTDTTFSDKVRVRVVTDIPAGQVAGGTVTGPAPQPPPGGGMTDEQFTELKSMLSNVATGLDGLWRDVVGRLKATANENDADFAAVLADLKDLREKVSLDNDNILTYILNHAAPTPEQVLLAPPAPDHFGIPEGHARSNTMLQDAITILLMNQAVWQRVIPAIDEAVAELKAANYVPKSL